MQMPTQMPQAMQRSFAGDRQPVQLTAKPDCEFADIDHLLNFAERLLRDLRRRQAKEPAVRESYYQLKAALARRKQPVEVV